MNFAGMFGVVGVKRIMVLALLLGANVVMALALYLYVVPEKSAKETEERNLRNAVAARKADIHRMQEEFKRLDEQKDAFEALKQQGFFSAQTRSDVKKIFSAVQKRSNVISAVVSVRPGRIEDNDDASKADYKVLKSPVDIKIKAMEDGDVYRYVNMLLKYFPGHLSVDSLSINRSRDVDLTVLQAIASGLTPELISADVKFSWRTMIPEDDVLENEGLQ